jgi:monothiol glutaredoxin
MRPGGIRELSAPDLKAMMDDSSPFELIDVRTEEERAFARIEGSRLLDRACYEYLLGLDRETTIVFQCHHGVRSYSAAEHFQGLGFTNVLNLAGGIDAWSALVDSTVPRY